METTNKAYSTHFDHLKDMEAHVGKELGLTDWVTIDQTRINNFANATEDHQWIHVNPERSKRYSPYKTTVAHGFLVLSLASRFAYDTYSVGDVGMGLNYGLNKVRFPNATPCGAMIRGRISLTNFEKIEGGAKYMLKVIFELKGEEKPACVAEFIAMAYVDPNKKGADAPFEDKKEENRENKTVLYDKDENIAIITLNRPDRYNAVNTPLVNELNEALDNARKDDTVRAVVITGAGKGFSAGADMAGFGSASPEEGKDYIIRHYQPLIRKLFSLRKPVIAAINGTAAGVGASIALSCDFRVMSDKSSLLYAFINIGLGPDGGGSWLLARQVGYSRAMEIAVEGKKVYADKCLELGLTNKVTSQEALLPTAIEWAKSLAKRPTLAVGITKQDIMFAMNNNLYDTIAFEAEKQVAAFESHDQKEGVQAFLEKRPPVFIGK